MRTGSKKTNEGRTAQASREAEERRFALKVALVEKSYSLAKNAMWAFCVCFLFAKLCSMLSDVAHAREGTVYALVALVEKLSLDRILLVAGNVLCGVGWRVARSRNRRLTKKLGEFRHALESGDLVRARSGLDQYGRLVEDT